MSIFRGSQKLYFAIESSQVKSKLFYFSGTHCMQLEIQHIPGLEKSTRPLVFTSASGCRASENLDEFQCKLTFFPYMPIIFVMQGKCLFQDISRPDILYI